MCGIIGITNRNKPIAEDVIFALKALEYRGYDSCGVIFAENFEIYKTTSTIETLSKMIMHSKKTAGLGHTRWATHGKVCLENAHPIKIKNAAIVHNGIIENVSEIKKLINYEPKTETDTEILLALFLALLKKHNKIEALAQVTQLAHGSFAAAFLFANENEVFWIKKGLSPLICAETDDGCIIASDEIAIHKAAKIIEPQNESYGICTANKIEIYPQQINRSHFIEKREIVINENNESWLEREINEQPAIFADNIGKTIDIDLKQYDSILLTGCGSAYIAATIGKIWLEASGIKTQAEIASEWNVRKSAESEKTLVVLISQSGETADTLQALRKAKQKNLPTLAITNKENSTIAKEADNVIYLNIGFEKSVASSKAFTAQLIKLFQLSKKTLPENLPILAKEGLEIDLTSLVNLLDQAKRVMILGKNTMYSVALEGALKMKELTHINIEAHPGGELKHGYIALIDKETIVITLQPTDETFYPKMLSNASEVKSRSGKIILFGEKDEIGAEIFIKMPTMPLEAAPFIYTIVLQKLALKLAERKNLPIDKPRNLAKAVTVE